jgi:glycosyltransferase involved in cell wall biosynthesis
MIKAHSESPSPKVSILTPVFNAEATLKETIQSILRLQETSSIEMIIVDDGSTDRSLQIAREFQSRSPAVIHIVHKSNGGEASALNVAWPKAKGMYVAILEADVRPAPDWLEQTLQTLEKIPEAVAVGGMLETPAQDSWISRLAGYDVEAKMAGQRQEVLHLTSANVLYRQEAFQMAGPFDEHLVNASLDSVFNGRLIAAGKKLIFNPRARASHHYKATLAGYLKRHFAYARYRVYIPTLELYRSDRWLAFHVTLAALSLISPLLISALSVVAENRVTTTHFTIFTITPLTIAILALIPVSVSRFLKHRDLAILLYPLVVYLRNLVAAPAYALGLIEKTLGRSTQNDHKGAAKTQ